MGVGEGNDVVDVELGGVGEDLAGVGAGPASGGDLAVFGGLEGYGDFGFGDEDFVAGVLAVAVVVDPVPPVVSVVVGDVFRDGADGKGDFGGVAGRRLARRGGVGQGEGGRGEGFGDGRQFDVGGSNFREAGRVDFADVGRLDGDGAGQPEEGEGEEGEGPAELGVEKVHGLGCLRRFGGD